MRIGVAILILLGALGGWMFLSGGKQTQQVVVNTQPVTITQPATKRPSLRLPAPRVGPLAPEVQPAEDKTVANLVARLENGDSFRLRPEQLNDYLAANHRNAESLVAAFRATGEKAFLKEALEKFPNDPQINFAVLFGNDSATDRQQRLEVMKQAAPDNALANYLAAYEQFKAGNADQAVQELMAAGSKAEWEDYSRQFVQSAEEAYRSAGYSEVEAKALAAESLLLPQLSELRGLGKRVDELAKLYQQAGDMDSAQAARQIGLSLGERFTKTSIDNSLMKNLVGIAIQYQILQSMDQGSIYDSSGQTVRQRQEELTGMRGELADLSRQTANIYPNLSAQELTAYYDRAKTLGQLPAMRWLVNRKKVD